MISVDTKTVIKSDWCERHPLDGVLCQCPLRTQIRRVMSRLSHIDNLLIPPLCEPIFTPYNFRLSKNNNK